MNRPSKNLIEINHTNGIMSRFFGRHFTKYPKYLGNPADLIKIDFPNQGVAILFFEGLVAQAQLFEARGN